MKKAIVLALLSAISASSFATTFGAGIDTAADVKNVRAPGAVVGPVAFSATAGVASNLIVDGRTVTKKNPSAFFEGAATVDTANGTFGVEYSLSKVNLPGNKSNSQQDLFGSYTTNVAGVNLIGKFGEHRFGGVHARTASSKAVILGAEYKGVFASVDKTVSTTGAATFDTCEKAGYTLAVTPKLAVTTSATFAQLGKNSVTKFDYAQVTADYAVTKAVTLGAVVTKGGRTLAGASVPSQFGVNATYTF